MAEDLNVEAFLSQYDEQVFDNAIELRKVLFANLPEIKEQIDIPAKMIAYCYGQRYKDLICTIFPSKKGLKLGFNRGIELPDPDGLLEGTGKISRYVEIKSNEQIDSPPLQRLILNALELYRLRMSK